LRQRSCVAAEKAQTVVVFHDDRGITHAGATMPFHFYIKATGRNQGLFKSDSDRAGEGRSLGYRLKFHGLAENRTNDGGTPARSHKPLRVLKGWGPSSPQYMQAFWNAEVLTEVVLEFVRADGSGATESPFERLTLHDATIVSLKRKVTPQAIRPDLPVELEEIGFRFEAMTDENLPGKTIAKYDWKNRV
jgi:type VI secretion system Hcp family effector